MTKRRVIVGISGATGFQYGVTALKLLRAMDVEVHLVVSKGADMVRALETDWERSEIDALADVVHPIGNLGASIASGSFPNVGMLVAPCSMRTLSAVAHCNSDNLLTRAADVTLKERRPLVLMARETPFNGGHLRNMQLAHEMGAFIFPPVPAFYHRPTSLEDILTHSVGRALGLLGLEVPSLARWGESVPSAGAAPRS